MKISTLLTFASLAACSLTAQAKVVGYWTFGDTGFSDSSGTGNNIFVRDDKGVALGSNGQAVFDGTLQQCCAKDPYTLENGYTLECFIRVTEPQSDDRIFLEFGEGGAFMYQGSSVFLVNGSDNHDTKTPFSVTSVYWGRDYQQSGGNNVRNTTGDALTDGEWHHLALVVDPGKDGTADVSRLYLDGVLQPNDSQSAGTDFGAMTTRQYLYLGARFLGAAGPYAPFVGELDDVRLSDGPLDPSEFLKVRSTGGMAAKVAAHWTFGENGFKDISGNGNDLSSSGVELGEDGQAVFSGNAMTCNSSRPIDFASFTDGYTLEFYIKAAINPDLGVVAELSENMNNCPGAMSVNVSDQVTYGLNGGYKTSGGYNLRKGAAADTNDGKWHHVAYLVDKQYAGQPWLSQLYIDGVEKPLIDGYADGGYENPPAKQTLYLGSRANGNYYFKGELDNVRVTAAPLTPKDFLLDRTWSPEAEKVYKMGGASCTIDVAAGQVVEYDRIETGCDDPSIMLKKTGSGVLRIKGNAPFAGVLDVEEGVVTIPVGFIPTVKPVAGRKLILGKTTITAASGESGAFTLDTVAGYDTTVRPRLAENGLSDCRKVYLSGKAQLSLAKKTVHGETGLAAGTDSAMTELKLLDAGSGDFERIDVSGDAGKYRLMSDPFLGWTPSDSNIGRNVYLIANGGDVTSYSGEPAPSGRQIVGLQVTPLSHASYAPGGHIERAVVVPEAGTYRVSIKATTNKGSLGERNDIEVVIAVKTDDSVDWTEVLRRNAPDAYGEIAGDVDLPKGAVSLRLRAENAVPTDTNWPMVLVDDVRLSRVGAEGAPNLIDSGWTTTGTVVSHDTTSVSLATNACITKAVVAAADGEYVVRLGVKAALPYNDFELRVNGTVVTTGCANGDGDWLVPVGVFKKGEVIDLSVKNVTTDIGHGTSNVGRELMLRDVRVEAPQLSSFSSAYDETKFVLDGSTRLWLDYIGRLTIKGLKAGDRSQIGIISTDTLPDYISSKGQLRVNRSTVVVFR